MEVKPIFLACRTAGPLAPALPCARLACCTLLKYILQFKRTQIEIPDFHRCGAPGLLHAPSLLNVWKCAILYAVREGWRCPSFVPHQRAVAPIGFILATYAALDSTSENTTIQDSPERQHNQKLNCKVPSVYYYYGDCPFIHDQNSWLEA